MARQLKIKLQSTTPILFNRFSFSKRPIPKIDQVENLTDKEMKDYASPTAYRNKEGQLIVPDENLRRGYIAAGTQIKGTGKSTLSKLAASGIMIYKPMILNDKDGNPITDFVPDLRKGRNPSTGGAVPIIRARVDEWYGEIEVDFDEEQLDEKQVREMTKLLGQRVGLCDFRPANKGSFGCFQVVE